jgi:hypothetical protein
LYQAGDDAAGPLHQQLVDVRSRSSSSGGRHRTAAKPPPAKATDSEQLMASATSALEAMVAGWQLTAAICSQQERKGPAGEAVRILQFCEEKKEKTSDGVASEAKNENVAAATNPKNSSFSKSLADYFRYRYGV